MSNTAQSLILRPLRASEDAEGIHAVVVASAQIDQIDPYSTLEGITPLSAIELILNIYDPSLYCVAEKDGRIVGYNHVRWWEEDNDVWLYLHLGQVMPAFRGQGIGTALLNWSESRIRQIATEQPTGISIYGANASSTEIDSTQLLRHHGYEAVFTLAQMHFDDFDSLSPVALPDEMILRPPTPEDAPAMRASSRAAWSKGIFGVSVAEEEEKEIVSLRDEIASEGQLWRVIMAGDDGNRNGAKSLYEKIGFRRIKTFPRYRKSVESLKQP